MVAPGVASSGGPGGAGLAGGVVAPDSGSGGGGGGGAGGSAQPGAFRNPATAVDEFLKALKAKDKDRLAEATARRSTDEAVESHRKVFAAILEQSLSDEELDDLAKSLEGFNVVMQLPAKSTGMIGIVIGKMDGRDVLRRTVKVRKEKDGWKVLDFEKMYDFKPVGTVRRPFGGRK